MGTEWEAQTYGRVSAPQFAWGSRIVERIRSGVTRTCSTRAAAPAG